MQAGRQQHGRSITQIKAIKTLLCPDFRHPDLKQNIETVRTTKPGMLTLKLGKANLADQDKTRRVIDIAAGLILGLTAEEAAQLAEELATLWCQESSVKDKTKK